MGARDASSPLAAMDALNEKVLAMNPRRRLPWN